MDNTTNTEQEQVVTDQNNEVDNTEAFNNIMDNDNVDMDKVLEDFKTNNYQGDEHYLKTNADDKDNNVSENASNIVESNPEVKEEAKEPETIVTPTQLTITDDYISSQPEMVQEILRGVKGKVADPQIIKNYINSQLYIKELKRDLGNNNNNVETTQSDVQEDTTDSTNTQNIDDIILSNLKKKYNIPNEVIGDPEERADFERNLNIEDPKKFYEYVNDYRNQMDTIGKNINDYNQLKNNWEPLMKIQIEKEVNRFNEKLEQLGIDSNKLGLNLKFDDNNYNEYLFNNILFKDGKPNADVVKLANDEIPVLVPDKIYHYLLENNLNKLLLAKQDIGRKEGYTLKQDITTQPSMSLNQGIGKKTEIDLDNVDIDSLDSPEKIESYLAKIKKKILG